MPIRLKKILVSLMYHSGIFVIGWLGFCLGSALHDKDIIWFFVMMLVAHVLTFRFNPLSRLLQQALITEAVCPGCKHHFDLVGLWKCCGFNIYKPRHAFQPCPYCHKVFTYIDCPRCETSIPV